MRNFEKYIIKTLHSNEDFLKNEPGHLRELGHKIKQQNIWKISVP